MGLLDEILKQAGGPVPGAPAAGAPAGGLGAIADLVMKNPRQVPQGNARDSALGSLLGQLGGH